MTPRGAVLRIKGRVGFLPQQGQGRVVVVQADFLNTILPTLIVVPLDPQAGLYAGHPVIAVSAAECGASSDHVAVVTQIRAVLGDDIVPGAVGHLGSTTLAALDVMLKVVLGL